MTDEEWTETRFRGHLNWTRMHMAGEVERSMRWLVRYDVPDDIIPFDDTIRNLKNIKTMATEMLEKLDAGQT